MKKRIKFLCISSGLLILNFILNIVYFIHYNNASTLFMMNQYDVIIQLIIKTGLYTNYLIIIASLLPSFENTTSMNTRCTVDEFNFVSFMRLYFKKALYVGLVFLCTQLFLCVICFVFASSESAFTGLGYGAFGAYGELRLSSPFIYLIICNINFFLLGFSLSLISQCIYDRVNNKYLTIPISLIFSNLYLFMPFSIVTLPFFGWIANLFPVFQYDFITYKISGFCRLMGYIEITLFCYLATKLCIKYKWRKCNMKKLNGIIGSLIIVMLTLGLCACQATPTKQVVTAKTDLSDYIAANAVSNEAVEIEKHWNDLKEYSSGNSLTIDADIYNETTGTLPVISVSPHKFDTKQMKKITQVFCPNSIMYDMGDKLTKESLEQNIIQLKQTIFKIENGLPVIDEEPASIVPDDQKEAALQQYKSYIEYYSSQIADAPSNKDLVQTSYTMKDQGANGEQVNIITFTEDANTTLDYINKKNGSTFLLNTSNVQPIKDFTYLHARSMDFNNEPKLIDYKTLVDQYVNKMGIDYMTLYSVYFGDGLCKFVYTRTYNNIQETYAKQHVGTTASGVDGSAELIDLWKPEYLQIELQDGNITKVSWINPSDVLKIDNDNVKTLSWETIKSIFYKQMDYLLSIKDESQKTDITITYIELGFTKILMKNSVNDYKLIPTWSFFGYDNFSENNADPVCFLTINALDGSIIDRGLMY